MRTFTQTKELVARMLIASGCTNVSITGCSIKFKSPNGDERVTEYLSIEGLATSNSYQITKFVASEIKGGHPLAQHKGTDDSIESEFA